MCRESSGVVQVTHSRIDIQMVLDSVTVPESGGIDVFIGTTRNLTGGRSVTSLSYEAYEPMALRMMSVLEQKAEARWPLNRITIVHRLGSVPLGEASVVVAVSAAHRDEAFEACRFLIDRLKEEVPIWKNEHFSDGSSAWGSSARLEKSEEGTR
jgi:molybdopterin synthase catalytic subunit